jgi:hypothetical protein
MNQDGKHGIDNDEKRTALKGCPLQFALFIFNCDPMECFTPERVHDKIFAVSFWLATEKAIIYVSLIPIHRPSQIETLNFPLNIIVSNLFRISERSQN